MSKSYYGKEFTDTVDEAVYQLGVEVLKMFIGAIVGGLIIALVFHATAVAIGLFLGHFIPTLSITTLINVGKDMILSYLLINPCIAYCKKAYKG